MLRELKNERFVAGCWGLPLVAVEIKPMGGLIFGQWMFDFSTNGKFSQQPPAATNLSFYNLPQKEKMEACGSIRKALDITFTSDDTCLCCSTSKDTYMYKTCCQSLYCRACFLTEKVVNGLNVRCPGCRQKLVDQGDYATVYVPVVKRRAICGGEFEGDFEAHAISCLLCLKKQLVAERKISSSISARKHKVEHDLAAMEWENEQLREKLRRHNINPNPSETDDEDVGDEPLEEAGATAGAGPFEATAGAGPFEATAAAGPFEATAAAGPFEATAAAETSGAAVEAPTPSEFRNEVEEEVFVVMNYRRPQ